MEELKPCPFCGGKARYKDVGKWSFTVVKCDVCGASTKACANEEIAKNAWNTRAADNG